LPIIVSHEKYSNHTPHHYSGSIRDARVRMVCMNNEEYKKMAILGNPEWPSFLICSESDMFNGIIKRYLLLL